PYFGRMKIWRQNGRGPSPSTRSWPAAPDHAGNISAQLNEAGWSLVERRQRAQSLTELLDRLGEQHGPLPANPERRRTSGTASWRRRMIVALDAEAFNALAGPDSARQQRIRRIMRAAQRLGRDVLIPSLVLAELYRGRGHNQLIDACL